MNILGSAKLGQPAACKDQITMSGSTQIIGAVTNKNLEIKVRVMRADMAPFAIAKLAMTVISEVRKLDTRISFSLKDRPVAIDGEASNLFALKDSFDYKIQCFSDNMNHIAARVAEIYKLFEAGPQLDFALHKGDHLIAPAPQHIELADDALAKGDLIGIELSVKLAPIALGKLVEQPVAGDLRGCCAVKIYKNYNAL